MPTTTTTTTTNGRRAVLLLAALLSVCSAYPDDWCPRVRCVPSGTPCGEVYPNATTFTVASCRENGALCLQNRSVDVVGSCGRSPREGDPCTDDWSCLRVVSSVSAPAKLFCSPRDRRCRAKGVRAGDPCSAQDQCARWLYCDTRRGECRNTRVLKRGEPCVESTDLCESSLQCFNGTCGDMRALGQECSYNASCDVMGTCSDGKCVPWQSVPLGGSCDIIAPWSEEFVLHLSESCAPGLVCSPVGNRAVCAKPLDQPRINCDNPEVDCPDGSYCGCDFSSGTASCMSLDTVSQARMDAFSDFRFCAAGNDMNTDFFCRAEWLRWRAMDPLWYHDRGWAPIACQTNF